VVRDLDQGEGARNQLGKPRGDRSGCSTFGRRCRSRSTFKAHPAPARTVRVHRIVVWAWSDPWATADLWSTGAADGFVSETHNCSRL
jgi:hypothetical protein